MNLLLTYLSNFYIQFLFEDFLDILNVRSKFSLLYRDYFYLYQDLEITPNIGSALIDYSNYDLFLQWIPLIIKTEPFSEVLHTYEQFYKLEPMNYVTNLQDPDPSKFPNGVHIGSKRIPWTAKEIKLSRALTKPYMVSAVTDIFSDKLAVIDDQTEHFLEVPLEFLDDVNSPYYGCIDEKIDISKLKPFYIWYMSVTLDIFYLRTAHKPFYFNSILSDLHTIFHYESFYYMPKHKGYPNHSTYNDFIYNLLLLPIVWFFVFLNFYYKHKILNHFISYDPSLVPTVDVGLQMYREDGVRRSFELFAILLEQYNKFMDNITPDVN